jgi:CsoR family transcriptional regulator, copper-sensing transcriptional repressor
MSQCFLNPGDTAEVIARLKRVEGQVQGLQRMIDGRRDCVEIIHQVTAARAALDRLGTQIVVSGLRGCVSGADLDPETSKRISEGLKALASLRA